MESKHWLSYSTYHVPRKLSRVVAYSNRLLFSVVLDDHARFHFSAIRLLLVYKPSARIGEHNLNIVKILNRSARRSTCHYGTLLDHPVDVAKQNHNVSTAPTLSSHICTIVFELVDTGRQCISLVVERPSSPCSDTPFRVVYDHVHPCSPTNASILVSLHCSIPIDRAFFLPSFSVHTVRILPITNRQRCYIPLPPHVIRCIGKFVVEGRPVGWRTTLLSQGLVCKSWSHVLDLFFECFNGVRMQDKPHASVVARSLETRPERAALMRSFNPGHFKLLSSNSDQSAMEIWQAFLEILGHAVSITEISMWRLDIHPSLVPQFLGLLGKLRQVEVFRVSAEKKRQHHLSMADMQVLFANWNHLHTLEVHDWAAVGLLEYVFIEKLILRRGTLTGTQLKSFAAAPLTLVELRAIQGLSNQDLLSFLSSTTATLTHLTIDDTPSPRSSEDEELAIDAVMPKMSALVMLFTDGANISTRSIARRKARNGENPGDRPENPHIRISRATENLHAHNPTDDRSGLHVHSVRVIPVSRLPRKLPELPPPLISYIIKLALGEKLNGWRAALLSFGLVCRSWACVLDLALGGFDEIPDGEKPGVIPVARTVKARPERAACIRTFSPWTYETPISSQEESLPKWHAILTILTHATAVEHLIFASVHPSIVQDFIPLLRRLRKVRVLKMNFPGPKNKFNRGHTFTMSDIQSMISEWEQLEALELNYWRDDIPEVSLMPSWNPRKIKELTLVGGKLNGPQLMLFTWRSVPCLRELHLRDVRGLSNSDLLVFLKAVAPTLSGLFITNSSTRATADEEPAIDTVMPEMFSLERLTVAGICSARTIARKPVHSSVQGGYGSHGSLYIQPEAPETTLEDVGRAMEVTTWRSVLVLMVKTPDWDEALELRIRNTAKKRGIGFHVQFTWREHK
ncbi:hypothetical protein D9615_003558 [Tricholomella constricta]|uniref:F-box domain-containing protein n=1 Tax=Tricholomella constricta TaxID=117010 RepID=A0A8H5HI17_9AGAR|nr:hypothetical protein D9615_003558 [Tricholomella constricta]